MIRISPRISLAEDEIRFEFVRASGPGGQNVNKSSTAAQLRFNARLSPNLPEPVKQRLLKLAGHRATKEGEIIIDARSTRSQEDNRQEALNRLTSLILRAEKTPKPRKKTRPTKASKERRLQAKKKTSEKKRLRGNVRRGE